MLKRLLRTLFLSLLCFMVCALPALADDPAVRVDMPQVVTDNTWHDYQLTLNAYAYCPILLEGNGHLDVDVQTYFSAFHYVRLLDQNYETLATASVYGNGAADPAGTSFSYDLAPGIYYVRVESWNDCSGLYRIKADFEPSQADYARTLAEDQSDDTFSGAVAYPSDTAEPAKGFLSSKTDGAFWSESISEDTQDQIDCYSFYSTGGEYHISLSPVNPAASFECIVYDGTMLHEIQHAYGTPDFDLALEAGTYYVCAASSGDVCGDYLLQITKAGEAAAGDTVSETADAKASGAETAGSETRTAGQGTILERIAACEKAIGFDNSSEVPADRISTLEQMLGLDGSSQVLADRLCAIEEQLGIGRTGITDIPVEENAADATAETGAAADGEPVTETAVMAAPDEGSSPVNVLEGNQLVVGFDADYPPYGYMDENGEYTGFDIELAEAVCALEGWELIKQPITWDTKDMELNSGSIDCIWSGFDMTGREDDYTWSIPYIDNSQVIVVRDNTGITSPEDLAGKIVGVQTGSTALSLLQDDSEAGQKKLADAFAQLQIFSDDHTAISELRSGYIDAVAVDAGTAGTLMQNSEEFRVLDEKLYTELYAIAFKKGNTALCDVVNRDLHRLAADGTFDGLAEKYGLSDAVNGSELNSVR